MPASKCILIGGLAAAAIAVGAFTGMAVKDQTYVPGDVHEPTGEPVREVAIVYYSRSGHSESVAREIGRIFNASTTRINADYALSFSGQRKAIADANSEAIPEIEVELLDIRPVRRLFLVSPTWMFRPATPLWAYAEQTDLTGKDVVLVMTGNSRYEQSEIDAFAKRIEAHGGRLTNHLFLRRGRIYWQKTSEELLADVRREMRKIGP